MTKSDYQKEPTYALGVSLCLDRYKPLVRELMAYDVLCDVCNPLLRTIDGTLSACMPSPLHWSRQVEYPWALLESDLLPHHKVLDAGAGSSVLKFALAKRVEQVIDVEYDLGYMHTVQRTIDNDVKVWNVSNNIALVRADVRSLPYPDGWFDRAFCISVLEHINDDPLVSIKELVRVIKPGGLLLLTMDIAVEHVGSSNDFHVGLEGLNRVFHYFNISKMHSHLTKGQCMVKHVDGIPIVAVAIKYTKPL